MRTNRRTLLISVVALAALSLACVTTQDQSPRAQPNAQEAPQQAQPDSGFTVGETAMPSTPAAGAPTAGSDGGFTVGETAVPDNK